MNYLRLALASVAFLALAGCSTISKYMPSSMQPMMEKFKEPAQPSIPAKLVPKEGQPFLTLKGEGAQVFRCTKDSKGTYYKAERPEVNLFNSDGEQVGQLSGPMSSFAAMDGSNIVSARIVAYSTAADPTTDMVWALMKAYSDPGEGTFNDVTYIQRLNTHGGLPLQECVPADEGKLL